jgi:hypothetical protein
MTEAPSIAFKRGPSSMLFKNVLVIASCIASMAVADPATTCSSEGKDQRLTLGEHVATVNGLRFHYIVAGHGPLVIVQAPGWGIGAAYLENGLAPLKKHFTLLTFDPRGTGGSSPVASGQAHPTGSGRQGRPHFLLTRMIRMPSFCSMRGQSLSRRQAKSTQRIVRLIRSCDLAGDLGALSLFILIPRLSSHS